MMDENVFNDALRILDDVGKDWMGRKAMQIRQRFSNKKQKYLDFLLLINGIYDGNSENSSKDQKIAELRATLIQQLKYALKEDEDLFQRLFQFLNPFERIKASETSSVDVNHDNMFTWAVSVILGMIFLVFRIRRIISI